MKTLKTQMVKMIQVTCLREFIFEDATRNGGAPNNKYRWLQTQKRFNILLYLKFEYRKKSYYKGGHIA